MTQPLIDPLRGEASEGPSDAHAVRAASGGDELALSRIRAGDAGAFDVLARGVVPGLCTFAARYVESRELAEELVQDVLFRVWMNREQLVVRESITTYLYRAVRNRALNAVRDRATQHSALARIEWMHASDQESEPALAEPEAQVQSAQLAAALAQAVDRLPRRWRVAFELVREHQLTRAEAAAVMGVTVKSVDMALGRAMKALRTSLRGVWP
jgi:RNA polymerase sigma-70 factor (ECF subfamily)